MIVDTPAKQLLFGTVRLINQGSGTTSIGTGFLMSDDLGQGRQYPYLVTNKHVIQGAQTLSLEFMKKDPGADAPLLGQQITCNVPDPQWVGHPDPAVDVAAMPIGNIINTLNGQIFYRLTPSTFMPQDNNPPFIDAIEDVTIIGYPDGLRDQVTFTPIVRRGITATPIESDIQGKPTFLVDSAIYGGSSGSPVFLFNQGTFLSAPDAVTVGTRLILVGIIAAVHVRKTPLPVEVAQAPHVKLAQELNLGIAYNWHSIRTTANVLRQKFPA